MEDKTEYKLNVINVDICNNNKYVPYLNSLYSYIEPMPNNITTLKYTYSYVLEVFWTSTVSRSGYYYNAILDIQYNKGDFIQPSDSDTSIQYTGNLASFQISIGHKNMSDRIQHMLSINNKIASMGALPIISLISLNRNDIITLGISSTTNLANQIYNGTLLITQFSNA
jgi:hypothetical protein